MSSRFESDPVVVTNFAHIQSDVVARHYFYKEASYKPFFDNTIAMHLVKRSDLTAVAYCSIKQILFRYTSVVLQCSTGTVLLRVTITLRAAKYR
jgi:hypothetical protein